MDKIFEMEPLELFCNVNSEILNNLYDIKHTSTNPEPHLIQRAKEDWIKLFSSCNFEDSIICETLNSKGYNEEKVNKFLSAFNEKKTDLLYKALVHHYSKYGETVTDFNWIVKLILGTNDLKTLRYPILQMIMSTVNTNGEHQQRVYDINKDMLAKIINLLEKVDD